MKHTMTIAGTVLMIASCVSNQKDKKQSDKPNIVIIYVDDLGYGDLSCYGAEKVQTPNVDRLAENGLKFTDGHCAAATCTPSRYTLLTGAYPFRGNARVLSGNAPLIIDTKKQTLPSMLQDAGYKTAVVGKWHLGLGNGNVDWNDSIAPGPLEIGFYYSWLIPATGDRVPCVFVENHHVANLDANDEPIIVNYHKKVGDWPTGLSHPELLKVQADTPHSGTIINGISRIGYMYGGESALWKDEDFPDVLTKKAIHFMKENKDNPFFLYFSFHAIHDPNIVNPRFQGKNSMGARGDHIVQMDWCTGKLVKAIERLGLAKNTLIFFISDNGPVLTDGYLDKGLELVGSHKPAGHLRGGKYSAFEGGTRVPTIAYWPSVIEPGETNALFSQVDLFASIASMLDIDIDKNAAPDSKDMSDVLLGKSKQGRDTLLQESYTMALRLGDWKYIKPKEKPLWVERRKNIESGHSLDPQLYNMINDPGEQNNLAEKHPEKVKEMIMIMEKIINK